MSYIENYKPSIGVNIFIPYSKNKQSRDFFRL